MKRIIFSSGAARPVDVPPPAAEDGQLLVDVRASCISPGTEMAGLTASGKTLFDKIREHPEKVKAAFERMKTEGVLTVLRKAQAKQGAESASGYSAAGVVSDAGRGVTGFAPGDRVAIAGAGYANHAEMASVPVNLAVRIPDGVTLEDASTCALGGIALQGVRRAEVQLGDFVAVIGCGAIGLLTVQLLRASGCRVIGLDLDARRLEQARALGAEKVFNPEDGDAASRVTHHCNGQGADRVIVTAATSSSEPLLQAFRMSRRKGRVVLVGVAGMELDRKEMYRKELDFVLSTSYGPGRYDEQYERKGHDYPYAYVRWTEQRNMGAYLEQIASGAVRLHEIIGETFPVERAQEAFSALKGGERPLLVLLTYEPSEEEIPRGEASVSIPAVEWSPPASGKPLKTALIGAGSFVCGMHVPNLKELGARYEVTAICDQNALAARKAARMFGRDRISIETDPRRVLEGDADVVLIGTRHDSHAEIAARALRRGKAVFVEKPMAVTETQFEMLSNALDETQAPYMVGFNRRFAPAIAQIRPRLEGRVNPVMIRYVMNGGYIPYDHWVHTEEGGGRIVGEGCHIFDLFRFLINAPAASVSVDGVRPRTDSVRAEDNAVITVSYADGSVASLLYTGIGSKQAPKERMDVFFDEQMIEMVDYKSVRGFGVAADWEDKSAEKGHRTELMYFADQILSGTRFPIARAEMEESWRISRRAADMLTA
ncbi:bi-domain-containing oxidoreductase [Kiritimatiella glycovorans]|uniref:Alcohol dehydrogenase n=1 Tax=Kiritimatiella glycovorans TaxID=1307763 RepID=A0A0G3EGC8_9BACT|nr:bi-domain-containing oxidoreductase [Kiritimatiella glycovorans]AKJ65521.1 Alcohol dehydrogenase [Kiritimatiella glycovorans]